MYKGGSEGMESSAPLERHLLISKHWLERVPANC